MSRSAGSAGRSGDPRKRTVQTPRPATGTGKRLLIAALIVSAALVALTLFALRPAGGERDEEAHGHAEAACYLTSKADEAAQVDTGARYAAAVLLLDKAIIESARTAEAIAEFADLDRAVQAIHAAAHRGQPGQWRDALDTALAACRAALG